VITGSMIVYGLEDLLSDAVLAFFIKNWIGLPSQDSSS
jgi:hypothetical protein